MTNRSLGPIPNRWLHCPRKSDTVIAERFLAFKTPLSNAYKDQMPLECIFPPEMIFGYCKVLKLKLGLWIDLTNTKRFYDREVVETRGTQYVKLQCRGHGETPSLEQTQSFIEIVDTFISERPFDIIAVHCTHGFNRTGFLIASYLVERLDCSVEAALSIFAKARPPGIYKQDYINELYRRYDNEEDATPAPELPDWCLEYDDSESACSSGVGRKRKYEELTAATTSQQARYAHQNNRIENGNGNASEEAEENNQEESGTDSTANGSPTKKSKNRRRELVVENPTFMAGVSGVQLVTDERLPQLRLKVQEMCGWEKSGFPGAQPVSMNQNNIKLLHTNPYRVSWKADGTRYMMLINKRDEIYLFDRNFSCFQVENLTFVKAGNLSEHLTDTLLDGEMVLDKFRDQISPRYLVYDIIQISSSFPNSQNIGKKCFFPDRLRCIRKEIIEPRLEAIEQKIIDRPSESFGVRNKEFWDITESAYLSGEKFVRKLLHEPDGLIFQPSTDPYTAGVCPNVLKWKPLDMNSVDFRLKLSTESGMGILSAKIGLLFVGGQDVPFGKIKYTKVLKDLDNKIIECTVNKNMQWEFLRERTDKKLPNSYNTAKSVLESIKNPVTTDILLNFINSYGFRDDQEKMPPPTTHANQQRAPQRHNHQHQQQQHQHHQQHPHQQQHHKQQQHYQQHHHQQHPHHQHHHQHQQHHQQEQHHQQQQHHLQDQHQHHRPPLNEQGNL